MTQDVDALRSGLVEQLKHQGNITDARVEQAFRALPRHLFVPGVPPEKAYADEAIPTKFVDNIAVSSISQPAVVAIMLEQLALREGEHVLEIGAGTGYNAALMAHLVGANGHVTTIDLDADIVERAQENLATTNVTNVQVVSADGGFGFAPNVPYDAIMATVGIWDVPLPWFEQLRDGGRFVAPIRFGAIQKSIMFRRAGNLLVSESCVGCGFMNLRGEFAGPQQVVRVNEFTVRVDDASSANAQALAALFATAPREVQAGADGKELSSALDFFALRGEPMIGVANTKERFGFIVGMGLMLREESIALVTYTDYADPPVPHITVFGSDGAARRFIHLLGEWRAQGRPNLENAKITAAPLGTFAQNANNKIIGKRWMEYAIDFSG